MMDQVPKLNELNTSISNAQYPKITSLHPKVADAFVATISEAKARNMIVGLHSGVRNDIDQDHLYSLGRTTINPDGRSAEKPMGNIITNAKAFDSWHNFGLAGDLVFKNVNGWTWNIVPQRWAELAAVAKIFGLEWGGNWTKFPDYPHFQMIGKIPNIHEAKKILLTEGVDKLWSFV